MIVFDLICSNQHAFEGWFASPKEFSRQQDVGLLSCPVCRDHAVRKRPSAIHINRHNNANADHGQVENAATAVSATAHLTPQDMQQVLDYLLKHTEDVGREFPAEARRIHNGESDQRAIRGQANAQEMDELRDEGIAVLPLPIPLPPKGKMH